MDIQFDGLWADEVRALEILEELEGKLDVKLLVFKALFIELVDQVFINKLNIERDD